jgi:hypothetical protein
MLAGIYNNNTTNSNPPYLRSGCLKNQMRNRITIKQYNNLNVIIFLTFRVPFFFIIKIVKKTKNIEKIESSVSVTLKRKYVLNQLGTQFKNWT